MVGLFLEMAVSPQLSSPMHAFTQSLCETNYQKVTCEKIALLGKIIGSYGEDEMLDPAAPCSDKDTCARHCTPRSGLVMAPLSKCAF